jgi:hypothetical protein
MVRLPNGRWVFEDVVASAVATRDMDIDGIPANGNPKVAARCSDGKLSDLDRERLRTCEGLMWARDISGAEWRKAGKCRYEASVGKRLFFVEFHDGRNVVYRHGRVGDNETGTDEWMLENSMEPVREPRAEESGG